MRKISCKPIFGKRYTHTVLYVGIFGSVRPLVGGMGYIVDITLLT